jgi:hypothetical protein
MKATIRTIALITISFLATQTISAGTGNTTHKATSKKSSDAGKEEAHFVKGATQHDFVMPVNPMQKPTKAPLV